MMCLDECVAYPSTREYVEASVQRTTRWAAEMPPDAEDPCMPFSASYREACILILREKSAQEITPDGLLTDLPSAGYLLVKGTRS